MVIRVILKSGADFSFPCSSFKADLQLGELVGYSYENGLEGRPVFLNLNEVAAIVRVS